MLLALVAGLALVLLVVRAAVFNQRVSTAIFPSTALLAPLNGDQPVNVLLIGYGGAGHSGGYLADAVTVLSVDPATDTTTTIPIPRDLWIEGVSAFGRNAKVNEVFADGHGSSGIDGGGTLLARVLAEVTGLRIDHWLAIDFEGFRETVDAVGGVTVDNPVAFSYATTEEAHRAGRWRVGSFEEGTLQMDGAEALAYARARYTSVPEQSSDFARSQRQARIMAALRAKLGDGGPAALMPGLRLMDAMEGRLRTDLSAIDLFLLSGHLSSDRRLELTEALTASTSDAGQYILLPAGWDNPGDYGGLRDFIAAGLASDAP